MIATYWEASAALQHLWAKGIFVKQKVKGKYQCLAQGPSAPQQFISLLEFIRLWFHCDMKMRVKDKFGSLRVLQPHWEWEAQQ